MKNDKKIDGDTVYLISVTIFAGTLSIGFILMTAIQELI